MDEPLGTGVDEPQDRNGAFPRLTDEQRARLRMRGSLERVQTGDILFRAGDETFDFFVVEEGAVTIVDDFGSANRVIAVHGAKRFLGELNLLRGDRAYLTGVVRDPGVVLSLIHI